MWYKIKQYMKTTKQIKNEWNSKAQSMGCKARIDGNKKRMTFYKWTGSVSADGYEIIVKINSDEFCRLTANYPELH